MAKVEPLCHWWYNVSDPLDSEETDSARTIDLDAPEIDRSDPSRAKAAADSDRLLSAELHCYVSGVPRPTVTWIKVCS